MVKTKPSQSSSVLSSEPLSARIANRAKLARDAAMTKWAQADAAAQKEAVRYFDAIVRENRAVVEKTVLARADNVTCVECDVFVVDRSSRTDAVVYVVGQRAVPNDPDALSKHLPRFHIIMSALQQRLSVTLGVRVYTKIECRTGSGGPTSFVFYCKW